MTPVEAGLRERKKERTHDAIRDAALELFRDKGYDGTTVDDIAAAADISPRTFFRYYANKEEVLFSKFDETLELLRDFLYAFPPEVTVGQALRAALNEFAAVGSLVSDDRGTFDVFRGRRPGVGRARRPRRVGRAARPRAQGAPRGDARHGRGRARRLRRGPSSARGARPAR
jgi:AcrR family transcriptional regulator